MADISISDPISTAINGAAKIISLFKADPNLKLSDQQALAMTEMQGRIQNELQQIVNNTAEATNPNIFVAGWRPFVGWVCGAALAYTYVVQPFMQFALVAFHSNFNAAQLPVISLGELMPVLLGLLGLGYMRTQEKIAGVAGKVS